MLDLYRFSSVDQYTIHGGLFGLPHPELYMRTIATIYTNINIWYSWYNREFMHGEASYKYPTTRFEATKYFYLFNDMTVGLYA